MLLIFSLFISIFLVNNLSAAYAYNIIPYPQNLTDKSDISFIWRNGTVIIIPSTLPEFVNAVSFLADKIKDVAEVQTRIVDATSYKQDSSDNYIKATINSSISNDEGYTLEVNKNSILITAKKAVGIFYAMQTIRQLLPTQIEGTTALHESNLVVPGVVISDYPRFKYRGFMLDVCRHWSDFHNIKRYIEILAMHKYNTFHWHLTEDQGWRIEIKKWPLLTEVGGWRDGDGRENADSNDDLSEGDEAEFTSLAHHTQHARVSLREQRIRRLHAARGESLNGTGTTEHSHAHHHHHHHKSEHTHQHARSSSKIQRSILRKMLGEKSGPSLTAPEKTQSNKKYGGYYTQDQIKNVVDYAEKYFIQIQPEIEMPGHAVAALASYPQFSCTGGPFHVETSWGVFEDVFCVKNETFDFLQDVLTEVIALFPHNTVHIGGDECPRGRWYTCPKCKETMLENNIRDAGDLQSYFIKRVETFLNSKDRRIIGWDEIMEGGLAPNAAVMSWRGIEGGREAARLGHDAVMTPMSHCYFDFSQERGATDVPRVYTFDPLPKNPTAAEKEHIIGGQANLWREYVPDDRTVEYQMMPRIASLIEALWLEVDKKNYSEFFQRLKDGLIKRYDEWGVNYCKKNL